ncbi:MAG TPA: TlpA disulfide reductase family protein, partial [Pyrinomonadaceae bacterium]|nr:TlpA disulfide reductase family protein [Pyrinomonadaceae bacterium]
AVLNTNDTAPAQTSTTAPAQASSFAPAPEIETKKVTGETFHLSDLHGRVVVLNFWATWCIPCREEIPELTAMQHDLEARGLSVVGAVWNDQASADEIKAFQKEMKLDYTILLNGDGIADKLGGIPSVPTTFIIDRDGRVRQKIFGQQHRSTFEAAIKPLLEEVATVASSK